MYPVEYCLDRCWTIVTAVPLAVILQLVIILFIWSFDRKEAQPARSEPFVNLVLTAVSAAFLTLSVVSGAQADYRDFLVQWTGVLEGRDPWDFLHSMAPNAYGPLYNLLALSARVHVLANKLLFAFAYLIYLIWLIKDFGPRHGLLAFSWPGVFLLLLNPFPWREIAVLGYFDVLVGLACVAAVHWTTKGRDWLSGAYLGLGILLKFLPIVILPFLAFSRGRAHFRLIISCMGVVVFGLAGSVLIWGMSTFTPLIFAATRGAAFSIYNLLASTHSPLRFFEDSPSVEWLDKPILLIGVLVLWAWCIFRRTDPAPSAVLGVLVTLLFYRVGWINYQMVLYVLLLYLAVLEWPRVRNFDVLVVFGYFSLLTMADLARSWDIVGYIFYSNNVIILLRFFAGSLLLAGLVRFSVRATNLAPPSPMHENCP
jgi:Glycosyltransferase family 87